MDEESESACAAFMQSSFSYLISSWVCAFKNTCVHSLGISQHLISVGSFHSCPHCQCFSWGYLNRNWGSWYDSEWLNSVVTKNTWIHGGLSAPVPTICCFWTTGSEVKREPEGTSGSIFLSHASATRFWTRLNNPIFHIMGCNRLLNSVNPCPLVSLQGSNLAVWLKCVNQRRRDSHNNSVNSCAPRMQFNNFGNPDVRGCQIFWFR